MVLYPYFSVIQKTCEKPQEPTECLPRVGEKARSFAAFDVREKCHLVSAARARVHLPRRRLKRRRGRRRRSWLVSPPRKRRTRRRQQPRSCKPSCGARPGARSVRRQLMNARDGKPNGRRRSPRSNENASWHRRRLWASDCCTLGFIISSCRRGSIIQRHPRCRRPLYRRRVSRHHRLDRHACRRQRIVSASTLRRECQHRWGAPHRWASRRWASRRWLFASVADPSAAA